MSDPYFDVYGDDFWRNNAQQHFNEQQMLVGAAIASVIKPRKIVDVGAGNGSILAGVVAALHDVPEAVSIAAVESPDAIERIKRLGINRVPIEWYLPVDLREWVAVNDGPSYDLAICLEVAEHLPEQYARLLIGNLCRLAPTVAFSAAYPGQGGSGHINERPPKYWEEIFREQGYELDPEAAKKAVAQFAYKTRDCWWYAKNLRVYRRTGQASAPPRQAVLSAMDATGKAKEWIAEATGLAASGGACLNLMCANRPLAGWRNHDGQKLPGITDSFWIDPWYPRLLETTYVAVDGVVPPGTKLTVVSGFLDNTLDRIYWNNGPEHVANIDAIVQELWRISKDGAKWLLITPGWKSDASWGDPTHFSHWSARLLDFYTREGADGRHYPPALLEYHVVGDDEHGLDIYVTVHKPGKGPDGQSP